ncbi:MAG TPA: SDR family oxidoreductase [Amycolatopsis sp.]|jgi:NAD(P)-dependent dehydrogenase (short-subunit alcohol dehydrogenase family)|nr:SDR family oxidoreductase [Amycolatopsis sp.]
MTRGAWVIGGGSGIGKATALRLARDGYHVTVSGRREEPLTETVREIADAGGSAQAVPVDVTDDASVAAAYAAIESLEVLVCSSGANVPNRSWSDLTTADFARLVDTNLTAIGRCVLAVLPGFRAAGVGGIVVVSSWAGWHYARASGVAYSSAKAGLGALVMALNDEEGRHGIRATLLCPGEVDTPIIRRRPVPPSEEDIERMLKPENLADVIGSIVALPNNVCINELVVTPLQNRLLT